MVSFQETAVIDVEMVRRPSPGRRRLRFSFPINDVKDQTGEPAPPFSARRRRGAAYLLIHRSAVNRLFRAFSFRRRRVPRQRQKDHRRAAEGVPQRFRCVRSRERKLIAHPSEIKRFFSSRASCASGAGATAPAARRARCRAPRRAPCRASPLSSPLPRIEPDAIRRDRRIAEAGLGSPGAEAAPGGGSNRSGPVRLRGRSRLSRRTGGSSPTPRSRAARRPPG